MTTTLSRHTDPTTSHEAADSLVLAPLERACLRMLREAPDGLTSEQLAAATGLSLVTVSPRLRPLANAGLIYASFKRKNRSGRFALVWFAWSASPTLF